jgi:hypothetical protein
LLGFGRLHSAYDLKIGYFKGASFDLFCDRGGSGINNPPPRKKGAVMNSLTMTIFSLLAQQEGNATAFNLGRIVGIIFLVVLIGAILWKVLGKK